METTIVIKVHGADEEYDLDLEVLAASHRCVDSNGCDQCWTDEFARYVDDTELLKSCMDEERYAKAGRRKIVLRGNLRSDGSVSAWSDDYEEYFEVSYIEIKEG